MASNNQNSNSTKGISSPTQPNSSQVNSTQTFSKIVKNSTIPKVTQAIVIDIVDGAENCDYLIELIKKTDPNNIIGASRISQNRFCCYLCDDKLVDELTAEGNNYVIVHGQKAKIRPFIEKSKRVIFSNVHMCIPNDALVDKLKECGVKVRSGVNYIRAGFEHPSLKHIISFRRQVFIDPNDVEKLPKDFTLNHDDTIHHIYVSTDKITCFLCQEEGHTSKWCKKTQESTELHHESIVGQLSPLSTQYTSEIDDCTGPSDVLNNSKNIKKDEEKNKKKTDKMSALNFKGTQLFAVPTLPTKRAHSTDTDSLTAASQSVEASVDSIAIDKIKTPHRKIKKVSATKAPPPELKVQFEAAKINIPNSTSATFPMTFDQCYDFVTEMYTQKYDQSCSVVSKYTENYAGAADMLRTINDQVTITDAKKRLTRIANNLLRSLNPEIEMRRDDLLSSEESMSEEL